MGSPIEASASLTSGYFQSQASQNAAETQSTAETHAADLANQRFEQVIGLEQPYTTAGYGALSALEYGLGIQSQQPTAQNVPAQDLVLGVNSVPTVNSQLYQSDPAYRAAWDQTLATHQQRFGTGYTNRSNVGQLTSDLTTAMQQYRDQHPGSGTASGSLTSDGVPQMLSASGSSGDTSSAQGTGLGYGSLLAPFTADTFHQYSPAYQFQLQQGQQGVLNGAADTSGALSGAAIKDLIDYNQGMANTAWSNAFNQYQTQQSNVYSRLANVANLGQNAASTTGQQGTNLAQTQANAISAGGAAQAAGILGAGNAWAQANNNAGQAMGQAADRWGSMFMGGMGGGGV